LPRKLSILVQNQNAFVILVTVISGLKILLSAIVPASFDIREIITLVQSGHASIGPWIALYPSLYNHEASNATLLEQWSLTSPAQMNVNLQLISLSFRLPIFAFDVATLLALCYTGRALGSVTAGRLAGLIWFMNPYTLFGNELLGVPDALATFLVIASITLLAYRHSLLSSLLLGLGVWIKFFPILLLPPLLLYEHRSNASRRNEIATVLFGLAGLVGYLQWTLPSSHLYLTTYSPVGQPFPFIAGQTAINNSAFVLILFYCLMVFFAKNTRSLIALLLPSLLVYYAISNPAPQYLVWTIPIMALDVALVNRSRAGLLAIFYVLAFTNWFFISSAFLTPSGYSLLMIPLGGNTLPWYSLAITQLLDNSVVINMLMPLVSSALYASFLAYAIDTARTWFAQISDKVPSSESSIEATPR
jgi:hypothetical protein